jgi:tRNA pseudouridine synthase 10
LLAQEKSSAILEKYSLCDHCLGRQFFHEVPGGKTDQLLGGEMRRATGRNGETGECYLCTPIRAELEELLEKVPARVFDIEFRSFLVGLSVSNDLVEREDELRIRFSLLGSESIRRELSREAGERLSGVLGSEVDFEKPDVTLIFDLSRSPGKLVIQINPIFVIGRYRKMERGISQTDRFCPACRGKGCEVCLFTGYDNEDSVESMISKPIAKAYRANQWKFHGAGREDVDARMLGNGRPFVVEALRPMKRRVDLNTIQSEINEKSGGRIEVLDLAESSRREMQHIKTKKFDKTYEVIVGFPGKFDEEVLKSLPDVLDGVEVRQQTPLRVIPRRKDTTRRRMVKKLEVMEFDVEDGTATIRARCESGLYVKELVTGDGGRTQPNISEIMGIEGLEVRSLDVVRVHDDFK